MLIPHFFLLAMSILALSPTIHANDIAKYLSRPQDNQVHLRERDVATSNLSSEMEHMPCKRAV
jgi:hypothetical protein